MSFYKQTLLLSLIFFLFGKTSSFSQTKEASPNIVLILVDDLGLMDLGAYGGEANTPNIDKLVKEGTMFTNYHTSPFCAPSRAMLLTGYDSHLTGVPNLPLFIPPEQENQIGYEGILNDTTKTVATYLKEKGYRTYITGKWHLGHTPTTLASKRGFDRTYILDASGADNYEHRPYLPTQSKPPWFEDGKAIELPDNFYSSRNLVDKMVEFMEEEPQKEKPFFSYLAFQAIHMPVQVPKTYSEKYKSIYQNGWDQIRINRFKKAKELGLVPPSTTLSKYIESYPSWDSFSPEEQKMKANAMAVNAGMIEAMDFHIGRYMDYLEQNDLMENTIFIITSDNGPEGSDPVQVRGMNTWMDWVGYHRDEARLGEKGYFGFIGPQFASAAASPHSHFKFYAGEGGMRVPLIISGTNLPIAQQKKAFSFVTDITPTILNLAGINVNPSSFMGKSLVPYLKNDAEQVYTYNEAIGMEVAGNSALFKGDLKLVRNGRPAGDTQWRLYNITTDPSETTDLATSLPNAFQEMKNLYYAYEKDCKVLAMPKSYDLAKEIERKAKVRFLGIAKPYLIGLVILLLFMIGFFVRRRRKRKAV